MLCAPQRAEPSENGVSGLHQFRYRPNPAARFLNNCNDDTQVALSATPPPVNTLLLATIALVLVIAFVAAAFLKKTTRTVEQGQGRTDVYDLADSLFSPAERSFFGVLTTIADEETVITTKVRLADVFEIKKGLDRSERQRALNRISAKHVDFLLIRKSDGHPILGIELDDASHQRPERKARDEFVDEVFAAARLPLVHIPAQRTYSAQEIKAALERASATT